MSPLFSVIIVCKNLQFFNIGAIKNLRNFTGRHVSWNLFLIKLQSLRPVTLIKKRLKDRCCSSKIRKFYRKTPALESVFNKTAGLKVYNFIKKRLQLRFLPVKFVKFLKTSFFTEQFQWLLLSTESHLNYIFT